MVAAAAAAPTVNCRANVNTRFPSLMLADESLLTRGISAEWVSDTRSSMSKLTERGEKRMSHVQECINLADIKIKSSYGI